MRADEEMKADEEEKEERKTVVNCTLNKICAIPRNECLTCKTERI